MQGTLTRDNSEDKNYNQLHKCDGSPKSAPVAFDVRKPNNLESKFTCLM